MNTNMKIMMHANSCNCASRASVPTLGIEMPYKEEKKTVKNRLAIACPEVAAMLSEKDKHLAIEVTAKSARKLTFVCPKCKQEFKATTYNVVYSANKGFTGCPICAGRKVVPGINDLASQCKKEAAMLSEKANE